MQDLLSAHAIDSVLQVILVLTRENDSSIVLDMASNGMAHFAPPCSTSSKARENSLPAEMECMSHEYEHHGDHCEAATRAPSGDPCVEQKNVLRISRATCDVPVKLLRHRFHHSAPFPETKRNYLDLHVTLSDLEHFLDDGIPLLYGRSPEGELNE